MKPTTNAPAPKKAKKKHPQYYKVVNTVWGHHGFQYKVGINTDPNPIPLDQIPSCGKGALYFVTVDQLEDWIDKGDSIAWITPISRVVKDSDEGKYKAHKVRVTKMLPIAEALPLIKKVSLVAYDRAGIVLDDKDVINNSNFTLAQQAEWLLDGYKGGKALKLLLANPKSRPLRKFMKEADLVYTTGEIKKLIAAGLTDVIGENAIDELRYDNKKLLKELCRIDDRIFDIVLDLL